MHYMLLIYSDENDWTETEREACMLASMAICDELIEQGRVVVNGKTAGMGVKVGPDDEVKLDGEFIQRGKKGKKKQKSFRLKLGNV